MATVVPFKGILYNPDKINDPADVTTPPYDVISPVEQQQFHERHPHNVIRLILGKKTERDTEKNNPHTRAADYFNTWLAEDIIKKDSAEAFYLKSIEYEFEGKTITRFGVIVMVGLEPFDKGVILPHEKTFSKVKSERLELMKKTHCNFCPIFSLYPDSGILLNLLMESIQDKKADITFSDDQDHLHKMWRITDPELHKAFSKGLEGKSIFIADGHHRYETALNYRNLLAKQNKDFNKKHPSNYVLMYLCSMKDPGLVVLPAHRLLKQVSLEMIDHALKAAEAFFDITSFPFTMENQKQVQADFVKNLNNRSDSNAIGLLSKYDDRFFLFSLKHGVMEKLFSHELDEALLKLDVTVLTRLLFMDIFGFDKNRLDNEKLIGYASTENKAVEMILDKAYDAAFILNPTKIEQVQAVAKKGLIMPRKSTYFYPKVKSGTVMNTLIP